MESAQMDILTDANALELINKMEINNSGATELLVLYITPLLNQPHPSSAAFPSVALYNAFQYYVDSCQSPDMNNFEVLCSATIACYNYISAPAKRSLLHALNFQKQYPWQYLSSIFILCQKDVSSLSVLVKSWICECTSISVDLVVTEFILSVISNGGNKDEHCVLLLRVLVNCSINEWSNANSKQGGQSNPFSNGILATWSQILDFALGKCPNSSNSKHNVASLSAAKLKLLILLISFVCRWWFCHRTLDSTSDPTAVDCNSLVDSDDNESVVHSDNAIAMDTFAINAHIPILINILSEIATSNMQSSLSQTELCTVKTLATHHLFQLTLAFGNDDISPNENKLWQVAWEAVLVNSSGQVMGTSVTNKSLQYSLLAETLLVVEANPFSRNFSPTSTVEQCLYIVDMDIQEAAECNDEEVLRFLRNERLYVTKLREFTSMFVTLFVRQNRQARVVKRNMDALEAILLSTTGGVDICPIMDAYASQLTSSAPDGIVYNSLTRLVQSRCLSIVTFASLAQSATSFFLSQNSANSEVPVSPHLNCLMCLQKNLETELRRKLCCSFAVDLERYATLYVNSGSDLSDFMESLIINLLCCIVLLGDNNHCSDNSGFKSLRTSCSSSDDPLCTIRGSVCQLLTFFYHPSQQEMLRSRIICVIGTSTESLGVTYNMDQLLFRFILQLFAKLCLDCRGWGWVDDACGAEGEITTSSRLLHQTKTLVFPNILLVPCLVPFAVALALTMPNAMYLLHESIGYLQDIACPCDTNHLPDNEELLLHHYIRLFATLIEENMKFIRAGTRFQLTSAHVHAVTTTLDVSHAIHKVTPDQSELQLAVGLKADDLDDTLASSDYMQSAKMEDKIELLSNQLIEESVCGNQSFLGCFLPFFQRIATASSVLESLRVLSLETIGKYMMCSKSLQLENTELIESIMISYATSVYQSSREKVIQHTESSAVMLQAMVVWANLFRSSGTFHISVPCLLYVHVLEQGLSNLLHDCDEGVAEVTMTVLSSIMECISVLILELRLRDCESDCIILALLPLLIHRSTSNAKWASVNVTVEALVVHLAASPSLPSLLSSVIGRLVVEPNQTASKGTPNMSGPLDVIMLNATRLTLENMHSSNDSVYDIELPTLVDSILCSVPDARLLLAELLVSVVQTHSSASQELESKLSHVELRLTKSALGGSHIAASLLKSFTIDNKTCVQLIRDAIDNGLLESLPPETSVLLIQRESTAEHPLSGVMLPAKRGNKRAAKARAAKTVEAKAKKINVKKRKTPSNRQNDLCDTDSDESSEYNSDDF